MINYIKSKKKLIVSYKNLSDDLRALFKETYPDGYQEYLQRFQKPNGEPLFVVPLETDDTSYMIKFDVKVDTLHADDLDKEMFDTDDKASDDDYNPMDEVMEKDDDMGGNHNERELKHGSYDGIMDEMTSSKKKKANSELDEIREEIAAEFGSDDDDDEYKDDFSSDDLDDDDDYEPTAEDLEELDDLIGDALKPNKKTAKQAKATATKGGKVSAASKGEKADAGKKPKKTDSSAKSQTAKAKTTTAKNTSSKPATSKTAATKATTPKTTAAKTATTKTTGAKTKAAKPATAKKAAKK